MKPYIKRGVSVNSYRRGRFCTSSINFSNTSFEWLSRGRECRDLAHWDEVVEALIIINSQNRDTLLGLKRLVRIWIGVDC